MNYSSWGEYFSDDNPIDRGVGSLRLYYFYWICWFNLGRFAKKSELIQIVKNLMRTLRKSKICFHIQ